MTINKQALRQLAVDAKELAIIKRYTKGIEAQKKFIAEMTPATVLELLDELEAAEKRISELEAREVVLPSVQDVHPLGPQSAKIFCEFHRNIINRCADEIRKVGINVSIKGG
ncbi:ead/Ea22-like family protein [Leclercia adecarboxylata]|uniref:ead/Ea22-like family protein n=1 Tax=Leclercia adecarboxylata TaxID=83655 RepID=UPI00370CD963